MNSEASPNDRPAITKADLPAPYLPDLPSLITQDDFGNAAFELLRESTLLVVLLVHAIPSTPFLRNEAILRGLLKRLSLLGKSLLSDICHNSGYQQEPIIRQVIEAAANYFYLADDDGSGERFDSYVRQSLAEEKASLTIVAEQIRERGGDPLPIEKRMRRSIERMASAASVDFEEIPGRPRLAGPVQSSALKRSVRSPICPTGLGRTPCTPAGQCCSSGTSNRSREDSPWKTAQTQQCNR